MLDPNELRRLVLARFPDAVLEVEDLTGTRDHYALKVASSEFRGLAPVAQHRLVYGALREHLRGDIHALALHTYTLEDWARR